MSDSEMYCLGVAVDLRVSMHPDQPPFVAWDGDVPRINCGYSTTVSDLLTLARSTPIPVPPGHALVCVPCRACDQPYVLLKVGFHFDSNRQIVVDSIESGRDHQCINCHAEIEPEQWGNQHDVLRKAIATDLRGRREFPIVEPTTCELCAGMGMLSDDIRCHRCNP